jgi:hypothetical protein
MAYSINAAAIPVTLMEQILIQHQVPFDILFDEQLDRIGQYDAAVILAGQECVSDGQIQTLLSFVHNGGTLVLTGNTAQYNDWRQRRDVNPLVPARRDGNGRIVYISEIVRGDAGKTIARMVPTQWVLPKNHEEIYRAVVGALPNGLSITSQAPLTTVMELLVRAKTREMIVHFVNFNRKEGLTPFAVEVKNQFPSPVKTVAYYSADADEPAHLSFQEIGGRTRFTVPATKVYAMIVIGCA